MRRRVYSCDKGARAPGFATARSERFCHRANKKGTQANRWKGSAGKKKQESPRRLPALGSVCSHTDAQPLGRAAVLRACRSMQGRCPSACVLVARHLFRRDLFGQGLRRHCGREVAGVAGPARAPRRHFRIRRRRRHRRRQSLVRWQTARNPPHVQRSARTYSAAIGPSAGRAVGSRGSSICSVPFACTGTTGAAAKRARPQSHTHASVPGKCVSDRKAGACALWARVCAPS